jgi:transposase
MKQRKPYPSDISLEQFEQIRPLLESVRKRTKLTTVDLYEVFNAVLYLLKSGCQWRMLPEGFLKWYTVYSHFSTRRKPDQQGASALERALKNWLAEPARNWGARLQPASSLLPRLRHAHSLTRLATSLISAR